MTGISQRAYARLRGVRLSAVQKAVATKRITLNPDGTIDPATANGEWDRNTFAGRTLAQAASQPPRTAAHRGAPDPPDQLKASSDPIAVFLNARAVNETFKARLTRLEFEERSGLLIQATKAGEYASQWSANRRGRPFRICRIAWRRWWQQPRLKSEIHRILAGETNALRRKMAKAVSDAGF